MSKVSIEWLLQKKITRAVVMVQKEFAEKLTGNREHKAISILANYGFEMKFLMNVKKSNFYPPPKVDSVVILLKPKKVLSKVLISTVNKIFSFRRKTVKNNENAYKTAKKKTQEIQKTPIHQPSLTQRSAKPQDTLVPWPWSPPLGQGPLGPRIDWASRGTFAMLAPELNCEGNLASRSAILVLNTSRLRARSCHSVG